MLQHKPKIQPVEEIIQCEWCDNTLYKRHALSFVIVYATTGMKDDIQAHLPFQCSDYQHFACCHDHAVKLAISCLQEHHSQEATYTAHAPLISGSHT